MRRVTAEQAKHLFTQGIVHSYIVFDPIRFAVSADHQIRRRAKVKQESKK